MTNRFARTLLRRIALGLPVSLGPIVVAAPIAVMGCLAGCDQPHCTAGPSMTTRHQATTEVIARLGMGASFMPEACRALCFELDGADVPSDAGPRDGGASVADAGPGLDPAFTSASTTVTCAYESSTEISCTYQADFVCTGGSSSCIIPPCAVAGRLPDALVGAHARPERDVVSSWLATTAYLESAAVPAFEDLAEELRLHGAPRALASAASRSARDERRHHAMLHTLAARVGARPLPVERHAREPRSLYAVALDNAIEGTVREAYGALTAAMQAERATSAAVRDAFRTIARDEARHALLSFAANDWAAPRLTARERLTIDEARRQARASFADELAVEPDPIARAVLGLVDATRATDALALV